MLPHLVRIVFFIGGSYDGHLGHLLQHHHCLGRSHAADSQPAIRTIFYGVRISIHFTLNFITADRGVQKLKERGKKVPFLRARRDKFNLSIQ
jgi:hypothetical protein